MLYQFVKTLRLRALIRKLHNHHSAYDRKVEKIEAHFARLEREARS